MGPIYLGRSCVSLVKLENLPYLCISPVSNGPDQSHAFNETNLILFLGTHPTTLVTVHLQQHHSTQLPTLLLTT